MLGYNSYLPEYNNIESIWHDFNNRKPVKINYNMYLTVDNVLWKYENEIIEVMDKVTEKLRNIDPKLSIELNINSKNKFFIPIEFKNLFKTDSAFNWLENLEKNYIKNNSNNNNDNNIKNGLHLYFLDNFNNLNSVGGFTIKNYNKETEKLYNNISTIIFESEGNNKIQSMVKATLHEILHTLGARDGDYGPDDIMFGHQLAERNINLFLSQESINIILKRFWYENQELI